MIILKKNLIHFISRLLNEAAIDKIIATSDREIDEWELVEKEFISAKIPVNKQANYLKWINTRFAKITDLPLNYITKFVIKFDNYIKKPSLWADKKGKKLPVDINAFSYEQLVKSVKTADAGNFELLVSKFVGGSKPIATVDEWKIYFPYNPQESIEIARKNEENAGEGREIAWCTAKPGSNNLFISYAMTNQFLYYVINSFQPLEKYSIGVFNGELMPSNYGGVTVDRENKAFDDYYQENVFGKENRQKILEIILNHSNSLNNEHPSRAISTKALGDLRLWLKFIKNQSRANRSEIIKYIFSYNFRKESIIHSVDKIEIDVYKHIVNNLDFYNLTPNRNYREGYDDDAELLYDIADCLVHHWGEYGIKILEKNRYFEEYVVQPSPHNSDISYIIMNSLHSEKKFNLLLDKIPNLYLTTAKLFNYVFNGDHLDYDLDTLYEIDIDLEVFKQIFIRAGYGEYFSLEEYENFYYFFKEKFSHEFNKILSSFIDFRSFFSHYDVQPANRFLFYCLDEDLLLDLDASVSIKFVQIIAKHYDSFMFLNNVNKKVYGLMVRYFLATKDLSKVFDIIDLIEKKSVYSASECSHKFFKNVENKIPKKEFIKLVFKASAWSEHILYNFFRKIYDNSGDKKEIINILTSNKNIAKAFIRYLNDNTDLSERNLLREFTSDFFDSLLEKSSFTEKIIILSDSRHYYDLVAENIFNFNTDVFEKYMNSEHEWRAFCKEIFSIFNDVHKAEQFFEKFLTWYEKNKIPTLGSEYNIEKIKKIIETPVYFYY